MGGRESAGGSLGRRSAHRSLRGWRPREERLGCWGPGEPALPPSRRCRRLGGAGEGSAAHGSCAATGGRGCGHVGDGVRVWQSWDRTRYCLFYPASVTAEEVDADATVEEDLGKSREGSRTDDEVVQR